MERRLKVIVVCGLCLLIALGGFFYKYYGTTFTKSEPQMIKVSGYVESDKVVVSSQFTGKVTKVNVDEGNSVERGGLLLESTDNVEITSHLKESDYQMSKLNNDLRKVDDNIIRAKHGRDSIASQLEKATDHYKRMSQLFSRGSVAEQTLNSSKMEMEALEQQYLQAQKEVEIIEKYDKKSIIDQMDILNAQKVETLDRLSKTRVFSPISGVITAKLIQEGEIISYKTPLFEIVSLDSLWVYVYVPQLYIGGIQLQQEVTVVTDAYPNQSLKGTISYISPEAEFTPKDIQLQEDRIKTVFKVKITMPRSSFLKRGMPVDVYL